MWKKVNFSIFSFQVLICFLGTFYKHIAFGWGLGDLLWYGIMYLLLIIHLILTLRYRNQDNHLKIIAIVFFILIIFICLKATIWRGVEYPWNGKIFYGN
jgi:hypothetical protein